MFILIFLGLLIGALPKGIRDVGGSRLKQEVATPMKSGEKLPVVHGSTGDRQGVHTAGHEYLRDVHPPTRPRRIRALPQKEPNKAGLEKDTDDPDGLFRSLEELKAMRPGPGVLWRDEMPVLGKENAGDLRKRRRKRNPTYFLDGKHDDESGIYPEHESGEIGLGTGTAAGHAMRGLHSSGLSQSVIKDNGHAETSPSEGAAVLGNKLNVREQDNGSTIYFNRMSHELDKLTKKIKIDRPSTYLNFKTNRRDIFGKALNPASEDISSFNAGIQQRQPTHRNMRAVGTIIHSEIPSSVYPDPWWGGKRMVYVDTVPHPKIDPVTYHVHQTVETIKEPITDRKVLLKVTPVVSRDDDWLKNELMLIELESRALKRKAAILHDKLTGANINWRLGYPDTGSVVVQNVVDPVNRHAIAETYLKTPQHLETYGLYPWAKGIHTTEHKIQKTHYPGDGVHVVSTSSRWGGVGDAVSLLDRDLYTLKLRLMSGGDRGVVNYPMLADHYPMLAGHYPMLSGHYPMLAGHYPMLAGHYPMLARNYPILARNYPILASHYPILADHYRKKRSDSNSYSGRSEDDYKGHVASTYKDHVASTDKSRIDSVEKSHVNNIVNDRVKRFYKDEPSMTTHFEHVSGRSSPEADRRRRYNVFYINMARSSSMDVDREHSNSPDVFHFNIPRSRKIHFSHEQNNDQIGWSQSRVEEHPKSTPNVQLNHMVQLSPEAATVSKEKVLRFLPLLATSSSGTESFQSGIADQKAGEGKLQLQQHHVDLGIPPVRHNSFVMDYLQFFGIKQPGFRKYNNTVVGDQMLMSITSSKIGISTLRSVAEENRKQSEEPLTVRGGQGLETRQHKNMYNPSEEKSNTIATPHAVVDGNPDYNKMRSWLFSMKLFNTNHLINIFFSMFSSSHPARSEGHLRELTHLHGESNKNYTKSGDSQKDMISLNVMPSLPPLPRQQTGTSIESRSPKLTNINPANPFFLLLMSPRPSLQTHTDLDIKKESFLPKQNSHQASNDIPVRLVTSHQRSLKFSRGQPPTTNNGNHLTTLSQKPSVRNLTNAILNKEVNGSDSREHSWNIFQDFMRVINRWKSVVSSTYADLQRSLRRLSHPVIKKDRFILKRPHVKEAEFPPDTITTHQVDMADSRHKRHRSRRSFFKDPETAQEVSMRKELDDLFLNFPISEAERKMNRKLQLAKEAERMSTDIGKYIIARTKEDDKRFEELENHVNEGTVTGSRLRREAPAWSGQDELKRWTQNRAASLSGRHVEATDVHGDRLRSADKNGLHVTPGLGSKRPGVDTVSTFVNSQRDAHGSEHGDGMIPAGRNGLFLTPTQGPGSSKDDMSARKNDLYLTRTQGHDGSSDIISARNNGLILNLMRPAGDIIGAFENGPFFLPKHEQQKGDDKMAVVDQKINTYTRQNVEPIKLFENRFFQDMYPGVKNDDYYEIDATRWGLGMPTKRDEYVKPGLYNNFEIVDPEMNEIDEEISHGKDLPISGEQLLMARLAASVPANLKGRNFLELALYPRAGRRNGSLSSQSHIGLARNFDGNRRNPVRGLQGSSSRRGDVRDTEAQVGRHASGNHTQLGRGPANSRAQLRRETHNNYTRLRRETHNNYTRLRRETLKQRYQDFHITQRLSSLLKSPFHFLIRNLNYKDSPNSGTELQQDYPNSHEQLHHNFTNSHKLYRPQDQETVNSTNSHKLYRPQDQETVNSTNSHKLYRRQDPKTVKFLGPHLANLTEALNNFTNQPNLVNINESSSNISQDTFQETPINKQKMLVDYIDDNDVIDESDNSVLVEEKGDESGDQLSQGMEVDVKGKKVKQKDDFAFLEKEDEKQPTDYKYTWGEWSECSVTCGVGQRFRSNRCENSVPCTGNTASAETEICSLKDNC